MAADFDCPVCGARVRSGALACPECGSDDETGWSEQTYLDDVGELWDDQPAEAAREGRRDHWWLVAVFVLLGWLLAVEGLDGCAGLLPGR